MRRSILFLHVALVILAATAESRSLQRRRLPSYFREFQLHEQVDHLTHVVMKNGLGVVIEEHPHSPFVAVITTIKVGQFDAVSGLAAQELLSRLHGKPFGEDVYSLGGVGQVHVRPFHTSFVSWIPAEYLLDGLEIHARLFDEAVITAEALKPVRRIYAARQAEKSREFQQVAESALKALVFGEEISIPGEVTLEDLKLLQRRFYHSRNAILTVSGSARNETVLKKLVDLLAETRPLSGAVLGSFGGSREIKTGSGFRYRHERADWRSAYVLMGFPVPEKHHADFPIVELVRYLLAEGGTGLLNIPLGEEETLPATVRTSVESALSGNYLVLRAIGAPEEIDRAEIRILALLRVLGTVELPALLMNRAKALMLVDLYDDLEDLANRAQLLARFQVAGDFKRRDRLLKLVAEISPADVRRVVKKYFSMTNLSLLEYFPATAEERTFTAESLQETLEILLPIQEQNQLGLIETFRTDQDDAPFEFPKFTPTYSKGELRRSSILRGPEIYLREQHIVPLVHIGFYFPGGRISETLQNLGISELTLASMLRTYARNEGGLSLARLEALGCRIRPANEPDFFGFTVTASSRNAAEVFSELVRWLRGPRIDKDDVEACRTELARGAGVSLSDFRAALLEKARKSLYADHPYGRSRQSAATNIAAIATPAVEGWKNRHMENVHPYILIFGDVEGTSLMHGLASQLSDSRYEVRRAIKNPFEIPESESAEFYEQVSEGRRLVLAFPGPEEGSYFIEMLHVAQRIVNNPGSGMAKYLSEDLELVDNIELIQESQVNGGAVLLLFEGAPELLTRARDAALARFRGISNRTVSEIQFRNAQVGAISEFEWRHLNPDTFLIDTMRSALAGEPARYEANYVLNVKQLRIGEVEATVMRFVGEGE
jgi:predicted Zn-dependent peptidase